MNLQFMQWGGGQPLNFGFEPPSECPACRLGIVAIGVGNVGYTWEFAGTRFAMYMFACPRENCKNGFLGLWAHDVHANAWYLRGVFPSTIQPVTRSPFIESVSPMFYTIFDQARQAEHYQLTEIAGMGYRKALEFLTKDYLISKAEDENRRDEIKRKLLGACINDYVTDNRIKSVAERAAWLGNDEAHYIRRWEDRDVNNLKRLIHLTSKWIEMELETEEALASMPKGGSP
ncbi:MAG TPA: hypothetical protein VFE16_01285 [Candidatus Cybelea sp.]|jgi:hypothetical protein|nr:hypothetical protein [Candidatus Cybelea sp.]